MKALLIANSPEFDSEYVESHAGSFDLVVVLDGALSNIPASVVPHVVCGDFDSLDVEVAKRRFPSVEFVQLSNQHANDLEKGLVFALERGAQEVVIACALGGSPAVSLANTSVMVRYHHMSDISMIHGSTTLRALSDRSGVQSEVRVPVRSGSDFACIAFENEAVVTLLNLAWELREQVLSPGSHGVGNTTTSEEVAVRVHRGVVILSYEALV